MRIAVIIVLVLALFQANAQKEANIWYFGDKAGIDFNSGSPVALTNGIMMAYEPCAVASDNNGNLLFYTDGWVVYNANHDIMPNSKYLMGGFSSTQGALVVPHPGDDLLFYLFTTDDIESSFVNGLRYSIVDMSLNGAMGDVTTKNIFLHDTVTEKLTALQHANGQDYWVLTSEWNTNNILAYLVTSTGVDPIPVISSIGSVHGDLSVPFAGATGYLKASPNSKKLVSVIWGKGVVDLFDFDNATGIISNLISLPVDTFVWSASFSPDNSKLYVGTTEQPWHTNLLNTLYQFDLCKDNPSAIKYSKTLIHQTSTSYTLQLAPDGKIYIGKGDWGYWLDTLGIIENPNKKGLACNYNENGFLTGQLFINSFPNFMQHYFNKPNQTNCEEEVICQDILFIPNTFTPNNDGNNDVLYVRGKGIQEIKIYIYNRWGEKVFESTDITKGWDGTYGGKALNHGVFVYYLEFECNGKTEFKKGNVTLLR